MNKLKKATLIVLILTSFSLWGCKTSQSKINNENTENKPVMDLSKAQSETIHDESPVNNQDESFRLIVSFISIGEGPDFKSKAAMDNVLIKWESRLGQKIDFEQVPWGREGEVDYCFQLKTLSSIQQSELITELRSAIGGSQLVQFAENQKCTHKR